MGRAPARHARSARPAPRGAPRNAADNAGEPRGGQGARKLARERGAAAREAPGTPGACRGVRARRGTGRERHRPGPTRTV